MLIGVRTLIEGKKVITSAIDRDRGNQNYRRKYRNSHTHAVAGILFRLLRERRGRDGGLQQRHFYYFSLVSVEELAGVSFAVPSGLSPCTLTFGSCSASAEKLL